MSLQNFSWVLPGKLAGSDLPGRHNSKKLGVRPDLDFLVSNGIKYLVSLEKPSESMEQQCSDAGIEWNYFPIHDFDIPHNIADFTSLVSTIIETFDNGNAVCVHCHAGVGRTGLVLSCVIGKYFLLDAKKAIATVRRSRAAIDTELQEEFVRSFLEKNQ